MMRLLPLNENTDKTSIHAQMQKDFLQEQGQYVFTDAITQKFLIENANEVIGFAEVLLEEECFPPEDLPEKCLRMQAFYIQPQVRDNSLSMQAFKLIRQWGRDNKASLIEIEVNRNYDISHEFLREQGLELVGSGKKDVYRGFI